MSHYLLPGGATVIGAPEGAVSGISAPGANTGMLVIVGADIGIADVAGRETPIAAAAAADDWAAAVADSGDTPAPCLAPAVLAFGSVAPPGVVTGTLGVGEFVTTLLPCVPPVPVFGKGAGTGLAELARGSAIGTPPGDDLVLACGAVGAAILE